jgi:phosphopentomutase
MMDSLGIGASEDADRYGDTNANTLAHILQAVPNLQLPNLARVGLLHALEASSGYQFYPKNLKVQGQYGFAKEISFGKDTPSGHWEMMGVPVLFDWGYFPNTVPCFPAELIDTLCQKANIAGVLGNCHASGTTIIDEWGGKHIETGLPIVYTSADSVFQIAAHEHYFGLERLYHICEIAREIVDKYQIGRVIARPFIGEPGHFVRTAHRKDYTTPPHHPTLLDVFVQHQQSVIAIGKIADIFAHQGVTQMISGENNQNLFELTITTMQDAKPGTLVFTNFVDFDSKYGHRRDVLGYAQALLEFDQNLPQLEQVLQPNDLVFIVADHGCDPTLPGSDHTREYIPVVMFGPKVKAGPIGKRQTFADVGQTIAQYMNFPALRFGQSFLTI